MKFKMIIFAGIFLLAVLAIGAASAAEDFNSSDADSGIELTADDGFREVEISGDVLEAPSDDGNGAQDVSGENVKADSQSGKITVPKSSVYKSGDLISIALPSNATGALVITKESQEFKRINLTNGLANCSVDELGVGYHDIVVKYDGSDYEVSDFKDVVKVAPLIRIPSAMTVGEDKYIEFELDKAAKGTFIVEADTVKYATVTPSNGYAKVSLAGLDDSDVTVEITYYCEDGSTFNNKYVVEVGSVKPKLIAKNVKMTYLDGTTFKITVYGTNGRLAEKGEVVDVKIGKKEFSATVNSNGVATLKIKLAPGKYKVKASYGGTTIKKTLTVKHALKLKSVSIKKSSGKIVLKATLKKGKKPLKAKKVVFKINGKKVGAAKSNKKGLVSLVVKGSALNNLKSGKKAKIRANYKNDVVIKSVKVK